MVDAVFVGSGINSMVGGALLARAGWRVCILERNPWLGGAIHTTELTVPGFRHEVFSSWHPLFTSSGAYAELGDELGRRGVEYLEHRSPHRHALPRRRGGVPHHRPRRERRRARRRSGARCSTS